MNGKIEISIKKNKGIKMSCEKLNCENCVKTNNHCCLADIPYDILTVLDLKNKANKIRY